MRKAFVFRLPPEENFGRENRTVAIRRLIFGYCAVCALARLGCREDSGSDAESPGLRAGSFAVNDSIKLKALNGE